MRYDRLITKLFSTPLVLEPNTRAALETALLGLMSGQLPAIDLSDPSLGAKVDWETMEVTAPLSYQRQTRTARIDALRALNPHTPQARIVPQKNQTMRQGWLYQPGCGPNADTTIIHIDGVIDKHLSTFEVLCFDATDLNDVDAALNAAAADKECKNILLYLNSPGGSVTGVPETADRIAAIAAKKNVFAFTDGACCSGAYWLAAACDQVFATSSAQLGSIGVYLALLDQTRALEAKGQKVETIKDGKLKAAGASWKTLTDDERAHFQELVDQIGAMFRSAITAKRPDVTSETMQGQAFMGAAARNRGLCDGLLPDLNAALAQF